LENTEGHVLTLVMVSSPSPLPLLPSDAFHWHKDGQGRTSAALILTCVLGLLQQSSSWQLLYWGVDICFTDTSGGSLSATWDQKL